MLLLSRLTQLADRVSPPRTAFAHCDIPCGVYDPEQARIEAESVYRIIEKYHGNEDPLFRDRCVFVKEQRADLAKHHLDVLWHDYFKPEHLEQFPDLHDTFWKATKACSTVKRSLDLGDAKALLDLIDQIDDMWKKTGGLETTRVNGRPN